jgi:hypothetical protein
MSAKPKPSAIKPKRKLNEDAPQVPNPDDEEDTKTAVAEEAEEEEQVARPRKRQSLGAKKKSAEEEEEEDDSSNLTDAEVAKRKAVKKTKEMASKMKLREPKFNVRQRPQTAIPLVKLDPEQWTIGTDTKQPNPAQAMHYFDSLYGGDKKRGPTLSVKGRLTAEPLAHPEHGGIAFQIEITNEQEQKNLMDASKKLNALIRSTALKHKWTGLGNSKNNYTFKDFCLRQHARSKDIRTRFKMMSDLPEDMIDPTTGLAIETFPPRFRGSLVMEKENKATPKTIVVDADGKTPLNPASDFKKGNMVKMIVSLTYGYVKCITGKYEFGLPCKLQTLMRMDQEEPSSGADFEVYGFEEEEEEAGTTSGTSDFASDSKTSKMDAKSSSGGARLDSAASIAAAANPTGSKPEDALAGAKKRIVAQATQGVVKKAEAKGPQIPSTGTPAASGGEVKGDTSLKVGGEGGSKADAKAATTSTSAAAPKTKEGGSAAPSTKATEAAK